MLYGRVQAVVVAFTQADVDQLDAAYKTGALTVRTADGRTVTYRNLDEYQTLRRLMTDDIATAAALAAGQVPSPLVRVGMTHGIT